MRLIRTILVLAAVANLTGCAFTSESIDIKYTQQQGVAVIPGADGSLVSVQVTDSRLDKSKVSSKKNGHGLETADITSNEDVTVTIGRAIEQEIRARGFKAGAGPADIKLTAEINRFYNDHKMGWFSGDAVADLSLSVRVSDAANKLLYSRTVMSQGKEANTQLATGNNAAIALDKALEAGMKDLFNDQAFLSALKRGSSPVATAPASGKKTTSQLLDDLAADKSLSYEEYLRRYNMIRRDQP